jgi:predicted DNA binding protein
MDLASARKLIINEGIGEDGIAVLVRMGDDPGKERFEALLKALQSVHDEIKDNDIIEKQLAHAIFSIAFHTATQISSWINNGAEYREELTEKQLPLIEAACESIFAGEWIDVFEE